ncbi:HAD family phosphatase [Massilia sp. BJB1822]|uniref:HAD family hydrolase n=1 Tax=Massilia sp. BJB1822 TaxID=2744470 RepID=UPI001593C63F|nr:HAD-IB family hydrolase [Massilia sp. BJB1822]NVD99197.1 HAD-IB family hydrolase [Massilia sp. BJB1822]
MQSKRFAFFDVDETLIDLKSMFSFRAHYHRERLGAWRGALADWLAQRRLRRMLAQGLPRNDVNRAFYRIFRGHARSALQASAQRWFAEVSRQPDFYIAPVLEALERHRAAGVEPVFVSGSSLEILQPLADALDVRHLLVNRLALDGGRFTGELLAPQTIGEGKRTAVLTFLATQGANGADCYGYGDHVSDLPLLECVGHPTVVVREPAMLELANQRGWPVLLPHLNPH